MNITNGTCIGRYLLFASDDIDVVFIKLAFAIATVAIVVINVYMIKLLWKKRRISVNLLFIILSCFDILNSMTTIPMFWILSTVKESSCILTLIWEFASIVSIEYPWFMITLIAIDRYLIITKLPMVHAKYMRKKNIFSYISISIVLTITLAFWYIFTRPKGKWLTISFQICLLVILAEFVVICSLYIHLVIIVYRKYKIMKGSRQRKSQECYSIRTAKTVFLLLLCLVFCNFCHAAVLLYINLDQQLKKKVIRNLFGWSALLSYLNSLFNPLIIINRNVKKQTTSSQVQSNVLTPSENGSCSVFYVRLQVQSNVVMTQL